MSRAHKYSQKDPVACIVCIQARKTPYIYIYIYVTFPLVGSNCVQRTFDNFADVMISTDWLMPYRIGDHYLVCYLMCSRTHFRAYPFVWEGKTSDFKVGDKCLKQGIYHMDTLYSKYLCTHLRDVPSPCAAGDTDGNAVPLLTELKLWYGSHLNGPRANFRPFKCIYAKLQ